MPVVSTPHEDQVKCSHSLPSQLAFPLIEALYHPQYGTEPEARISINHLTSFYQRYFDCLTFFTRTSFLQSLGLLNFTVMFFVAVGGVDDGYIRQGVVGHVDGDLDVLLMDSLLTGDT